MNIESNSSRMTLPADWGPTDKAILAGLTIIGLAYFGQYYDSGFNIADEGSVVLIAARLLEGERPFVDVLLGYGLFWYYPLVLLFEITGVSFIAARIYFFLLALITCLLAFLVIRRHSHRRGLATGAALLILAIPGTVHKAYIPLIVVANMLCLPSLDPRRTIVGPGQVLSAGLVAAVSYHIRPDLGLVAALMLVGTLVTHVSSRSSNWPEGIYQIGKLSTLLCAAAFIPTLPLAIFARSHGFLEPFFKELYRPIKFLSETVDKVIVTMLDLGREAVLGQVAWAAPERAVDSAAPAEAGKQMARIPWSAVWEAGPQQSFAALTYLPLFSLALIASFTLFAMLRNGLKRRPMVTDDTVGIVAVMGLTCSAFPQFFLFRPDPPHLAQFMPGFIVLIAISLERWVLPTRSSVRACSDTPLKLPIRVAAVGFLIFHLGLYTWFAVRLPASGSIALARGRTERFLGANGVDVVVKPHTKKLFAAVTRIAETHTNADDLMLCLPYCPGLNVIAQRRTFLRRLYVDDVMLKLNPQWQQKTIARIRTEQVALIVIQDWAVNRTEISRFQNWATELMEFIAADYQLVERIGTFRFYVRRAELSATFPPNFQELPLRMTM